MAGDTTDSTSATLEATAGAENSTGAEHSENRENAPTSSDYQARVEALEAERTALTADKAKLASDLAAMQRRAEDLDKGYRTYQQRTTPRMQRLAELERWMQNEAGTKGELVQMQAVLNRLAGTLLEDSDKQQLGIEIERAKLAMQQAQLTQQQNAQTYQDNTPIATVDPDEYKQQLLATYFPGTSVSYDDARIDWGGNAKDLNGWLRIISPTILAIEREEEKKRNDAVNEDLRKANEATLRTATEQAKIDAAAEARKNEEERLRKLGVDVVDTAIPEGERKLQQRVEEELDESLLSTPAGRVEFERRKQEIARAHFMGNPFQQRG